MKIGLGWFGWAVYELAGLVVGALGLVVLLPLAFFQAWENQPTRLEMFRPRTVLAWRSLPQTYACFALILAVYWLSGRSIASAYLIGVPLLVCDVFDFWSNDEDGVTGSAAFMLSRATSPLWLDAYVWSARRNFANGMRVLPGAAYVVTKDDVVTTRTTKSGHVTTCGWRQCVVWRGLRFGYLIQPEATAGYRVWPVAGRA